MHAHQYVVPPLSIIFSTARLSTCYKEFQIRLSLGTFKGTNIKHGYSYVLSRTEIMLHRRRAVLISRKSKEL